MDRRLVLTGLAGLVAAPALAQNAVTPQSPAAQSGGAAGGVYGNQGATSPAAGTQAQGMSQSEQQWMQQTMMAGSVALQTSEIALQKAQDEDVKKFAKFEADEQKGIAEVLRSMMEPAGTASAGANPQPDAKHAEMVQKLQQAKPGEAFDKDYVQGQIQGHQELLQIQENFLRNAGGGGNREAVNVAKLARSRIQEHIETLQDLDSAL
jgi:putative membrane protein